jgi:hypothetical protein
MAEVSDLSVSDRYLCGYLGVSEEDKAFFRQLVIPEEDRFKYMSRPWAGEYRWFRSPNVVCLEHYRRRPATPATDAVKNRA